MGKKCIIFDFDGVVIDSFKVQKKAFFGSYHEVVGKGEPDFDEFMKHSGNSLTNIFRIMNLPAEMLTAYVRISRQILNEVELITGIRDLLQELSQRDIFIALCTGKDRQRTMEILTHLAIKDFFPVVVCSDDVARPKPDPESLLKIIDMYGCRKDDTVMIGDSMNDYTSAQRAGVACTFINTTYLNNGFKSDKAFSYSYTDTNGLRKLIMQFIQPGCLINDLVICENICNQKCSYCLTTISQFKTDGYDQPDRNVTKVGERCYVEGSSLKQRLDLIMDSFKKNVNTSILKISGGEVFLIKGITDFLKKEHENYRLIQVLTNGTAIEEDDIAELAALRNVFFQVSLDHHTLAGNFYRSKTQKTLTRVLNTIELIVKHNIPLEINCVLTDKNTANICAFVEYLNQYKDKVVLLPFPVRGAERDKFLPAPEQLEGLTQLLQCYTTYKESLPPQAYLLTLKDFLERNRRQMVCYLPFFAVGSFDDGIITPCPNYWLMKLGNLFDDNPQQVFDKIGNHRIYSYIRSNENNIKPCQLCFTPWELINLFIEDRVSIQELAHVPFYASTETQHDIKRIKQHIKN